MVLKKRIPFGSKRSPLVGKRSYIRAAVGHTGPELDIALKLLHDLGSLHAHLDGGSILYAVLYPGGAVRAGKCFRSEFDAFSKSTSSHVNRLRVDVGVGIAGLVMRVNERRSRPFIEGRAKKYIPWFCRSGMGRMERTFALMAAIGQ